MNKTVIDESWLHDDLIKFINDRNGILQNVEVRRILSLEDEVIKFDRLYIQDCVFTDKVFIGKINNRELTIEINSSTFLQQLRIDDSEVFSLCISSSNLKRLTIDEVSIINDCRIDVIDQTEVSLYNLKGELIVYLANSYRGQFLIDSKEGTGSLVSISNTAIVKIKEVESFDLSGSFNILQIGKYNEIEISDHRTLIDGTDAFFNEINQLSLLSKSNKGTLIIEEMEIENFDFFYFLNTNGIASLQNLKIKNTSIQNSILGPINLNNVVFSDKLEIERSDISKITYSNVSWIKETYVTLFDDVLFLKSWLSKDDREELKEDIIELRDNRETYRQLKLVAQNMKNKHDELEFARLENRLLWKEARVSKSMNWQDRFIIFTNRWSADFGQSWFMPFAWLFGIHFILFMSIFKWQFSCHLTDFEYGLGEYVELLNPAHRSPEYINTGMGKVTEFFMRISGGFFIYHFLRATRKYVQG